MVGQPENPEEPTARRARAVRMYIEERGDRSSAREPAIHRPAEQHHRDAAEPVTASDRAENRNPAGSGGIRAARGAKGQARRRATGGTGAEDSEAATPGKRPDGAGRQHRTGTLPPSPGPGSPPT